MSLERGPSEKPWVVLICRRCSSDSTMGRHQRELAVVRSDDSIGKLRRPGQPPRQIQTRTVAVTVRGHGFEEYTCRGCGARFMYRQAEILSMVGRARNAGESQVLLRPNLGRTSAPRAVSPG